jgi:hypothetical protein
MKTTDVFPQFEPPPHGWQRMRARLPDPRRQAGAFGFAALAVATSLLLFLVKPGEAIDLMPAARDSVAGGALGLDAPLSAPVEARGEGVALMPLTSSNPSVLMFRIASLPAPDAK